MPSFSNNHKTAQQLLTKKVPIVFEDQTIGDVEKILIQNIKKFKTINYIYVLNEEKKLQGVLSIKEVFRSPKKILIKKLVNKNFISIRAHTDQERAAYIALKNRVKALPVIDKNGKFLGAISSDVILETLHYETSEDIMRLGGITHTSSFDNVFKLSVVKSLKHRLPWLLVGLLGGMFASGIVDKFETTLSQNLILAAFIPLIVYMADAVGTQMEAFIIRDLAINPELKFFRYLCHQLLIVILTGLIVSVLAFGGITLFYQDIKVSFVVALALFSAIVSSLFSGLIIPFLFSKLKLDPANASGPIATIIQDIASITVYFSIAYFLL